jgi:uncharacterized protein with ParB-like and HNH nuclease domain
MKITSLTSEDLEAELRQQQVLMDYNTVEYSVEMLVEKYSDGLNDGTNELFVQNHQQERAWDNIKQSKFIEFMLLGLPLPSIFVADVSDKQNKTRLKIIDGTQRIHTLAKFINNDLKLQSLEKLKKINGFRFIDLHLSRQRSFKRISIRVVKLTGKATEDICRDIFERVN